MAHKLLPKNISGIPKLDKHGFNKDGTLSFTPQIGFNYIQVHQYPIPWDITRRLYIGDVKLQSKKMTSDNESFETTFECYFSRDKLSLWVKEPINGKRHKYGLSKPLDVPINLTYLKTIKPRVRL